MTREFEFTIPGPVVAQSRPKAHRVGDKVIMHDVPKCVSYKMDVASCAYKEIMRRGITVPVLPDATGFAVLISISKGLLKSMSKKKARMALAGDIRPTSKPDLDNAAKGILDALKGVFWKDDSAVTMLRVEKRYAEMDSAHVRIVWNEPDV